MTVKRLIEQLEKYNPKAEVRLNDSRGTTALFALSMKDKEDFVWIEGKSDIDLGEEIAARFEKAAEDQMDELDFFMDLIDMGITLKDIKEFCPDKYDYSKGLLCLPRLSMIQRYMQTEQIHSVRKMHMPDILELCL